MKIIICGNAILPISQRLNVGEPKVVLRFTPRGGGCGEENLLNETTFRSIIDPSHRIALNVCVVWVLLALKQFCFIFVKMRRWNVRYVWVSIGEC